MAVNDECWVWTGGKIKGYGCTKVDGKTQYIHRLAYEELVGPIPEGLQLDHLCRNPACYNPRHLEPVTAAENQRRAIPFRVLKGPRRPESSLEALAKAQTSAREARHALAQRDSAIREAVAQGASLRAVADVTCLSFNGIKKIAARQPKEES